MNNPDELIGVREAARRLGVHENSIRNWSNRGIITAHYRPGSGYRQFLTGDIDQLVPVVQAGKLEQLAQSAAAVTTQELAALLTVARMYLDVFRSVQHGMTPEHHRLYVGIEGIVARYAT